MKVVVVGAGIMGALCAFRLAQAGAEVTIVEAGYPASGASGASFGWVNASFYLNRDHFDLRCAAFDAHRRLARDLRSDTVSWTGCLSWECEGAEFDAQYQELVDIGYDARVVEQSEVQRLEPMIAAPERAMLFGSEGAVDLLRLTQDALGAASACGARLMCGTPVSGLVERHGKIAGIEWKDGAIDADWVVLATGVATQALLSSVDVLLPMLDRPAVILRSEPMPPLISHVLVTPGQEIRQQPNGQILAPTVAAHQGAKGIPEEPDLEGLADSAIGRVADLLCRNMRWTELLRAARPMPADGLPVMGACGPDGLYVCTMHSGATLAPLAAEIVTADISGSGRANALTALATPFRPQRFRA